MPKTITLSQQEWKDLAERIGIMGQIFQQLLTARNQDGMGALDAQDCAADIICAMAAINYVAYNAADKCIFVGV